MVKKLKLAILFGGKSVEHEVSLMSAKNIISSIDKNKYEIKKIKIGKNGKMPKINFQNFDVIFPVLHGTFGEEGSIQGFFKILNIPYVGTGILGSAICMDKVVTKKLLERENIKVAKYLTYEWYEKNKIGFTKIQKYLVMPFFVKPANCGSSVGVNKISDKKNLIKQF